MVQFPLSLNAHPELELIRRKLSRRIPRPYSFGSFAQQQASSPTLQQRVAVEIRTRRDRICRFGSQLFSDPAWDMLLALYEAHLRSECMFATDLCIASSAPVNVARRWISVLERQQLIVPANEPKSAYEVSLRLSPRGAELMSEHFSAAP
jgi:hypothetical protein